MYQSSGFPRLVNIFECPWQQSRRRQKVLFSSPFLLLDFLQFDLEIWQTVIFYIFFNPPNVHKVSRRVCEQWCWTKLAIRVHVNMGKLHTDTWTHNPWTWNTGKSSFFCFRFGWLKRHQNSLNTKSQEEKNLYHTSLMRNMMMMIKTQRNVR